MLKENEMKLSDWIIMNAEQFGIDKQNVELIVEVIHEPLASASTFYDITSNEWLYQFGAPFLSRNHKQALGTQEHFQPVLRLIAIIGIVMHHFGVPQRVEIIKRLNDNNPGKHRAVIEEFIPLLRALNLVGIWYEVPGIGCGNKTADWILKFSDNTVMQLEVKNRTYDIAEVFLTGESTSFENPYPPTTPEKTLLSIIGKFSQVDHKIRLQGAWINVSLKHGHKEFNEYIDSIEDNPLHFIILTIGGGDEAFIWCRSGVDRKEILERFRLKYSEKIFYDK